MLYGMADAEKQALVDLGHRLRIYMPYGELIPGMAYLVRRLLENTSNDSFLRAGFVEQRAAGGAAGRIRPNLHLIPIAGSKLAPGMRQMIRSRRSPGPGLVPARED